MSYKFRLLFIVLTIIVLGQGQAFAQNVKTVQAVGYADYNRNRPDIEAEAEALFNAFGKAVDQALGVEIQSVGVRTVQESSSGLEDRFFKVVGLSSNGHVTKYEIIDARWLLNSSGARSAYQVEIEAEVTADLGRPDQGFTVSMSLNQPSFYVRRNIYNSDVIEATIKTSQDAYLTIFEMSHDSIQVLLPNSIYKTAFVKANEEYVFPPAGLQLIADLLPQQEADTKLIIVVATKNRIDFTGQQLAVKIEDGNLEIEQAQLMALNNWLVKIPAEQRVLTMLDYEIKRAGN